MNCVGKKNNLALNGEPIACKEHAHLFQDVGMIRGEYLLREINKSILRTDAQLYVRKYLAKVCAIYEDNTVWYRTSELTIPEINTLVGTEEMLFEQHELLGMRGIRRSLHNKDEFRAEIETINKVRKKHDNLHIFFPFVHSCDQLQEAIDFVRSHNYTGEIGTMIEVPSLYRHIREVLANPNIARIVLGLNDFTSFYYGAMRQSAWFDMQSKDISAIIADIKYEAARFGVEFNVAGYLTPAMIAHLNEQDIRAIIHYHQIPELFTDCTVRYPNHVREIKRQTKENIRQARLPKQKGRSFFFY
jgi:signal transduction protein with GAF and PtsI domain